MSEEISAELVEVEAQLRRVLPARPGINRDTLMFEAGRATGARTGGKSAARMLRFWQGGCAALLMVSLGMGCVVAGTAERFKGGGRDVVVYLPQAKEMGAERAVLDRPSADGAIVAAVFPRAAAEPDYLKLRRDVLASGVGVLETESGGGSTGSGGKSAATPALRGGDGLEALPAWQRRQAIIGGRS